MHRRQKKKTLATNIGQIYLGAESFSLLWWLGLSAWAFSDRFSLSFECNYDSSCNNITCARLICHFIFFCISRQSSRVGSEKVIEPFFIFAKKKCTRDKRKEKRNKEKRRWSPIGQNYLGMESLRKLIRVITLEPKEGNNRNYSD